MVPRRMVALAAGLALLWSGVLFAAGQGEPAAAQKKTVLSWAAWTAEPVDENSFAEQAIERAFPDIDLKILAFERPTWWDQINTRVAGGDIPDIIYRDSRSYVVQYVAQGILAEIPISMVKQYAPGMFKDAKDYGTAVWFSTYIDGKNYGIPYVQPKQLAPFTEAWRADWLRTVGITKIPETVAEMEEAFRRFTFNDPDGNGKQDTYGTVLRGKDAPEQMLVALNGAYGAFPARNMILPDGTIQLGFVHDGTREFLRTLNKWYKEGIVDKEFITTDWALLKEKWNNGRAGYAGGATWYRLYKGTELYDGLMAVNPKAEIVMAPPVKGPKGYSGYMQGGKASSCVSFSVQLANDQAKLTRAIQMVDRVMSDFQLLTAVQWGQEGVHWKRDPVLGSPTWIEPYTDPQKRGPLGVGFFWGQPGVWSNMMKYERSDYAGLTKYATAGTMKSEVQYTSLITVPADIGKIEKDLSPVYRQWMMRFITGDANIETQWSEYLADLGARGLDKVHAARNAAYKDVARSLAEIEKQL